MRKTEIVLLLVVVLVVFGCAQSRPAATYTESPFTPPALVPPPVVAEIDSQVIIEPNPGPGPYTGIAMGYGGVVEVTLDVKDRVIISADAIDVGETLHVGSLAIDNMPGMMVEANSIEVDTLSGATITSRAILEAAAKALGKAGLTNADLKR